LMVRFEVPLAEWADRLPRSDATRVLILAGVDRGRGDAETRRRLLSEFLQEGSTEVELPRWIAYYGERWGELALARHGAAKWREAAIGRGEGEELARATVSLARLHLTEGAGDRAYQLLRETLSLMEERSLPTESALELLCALGDEYRNRRQYAMAQALFSEALTLSRYHAPAYLGLARNYRALGELENAQKELTEILAFDPSHSQALRELEELATLSLSRR
ncbi:MAG: tetratricopeptide repeat protein, partial [Vicinamibacteria bacterium]